MSTHIEQQVAQALKTNARYFSQTFPINSDLLTLLSTTEQGTWVQRFFWQTPDKQTTLLALDALAELKAPNSEKLTNFEQQMKEAVYSEGRAPVIVGSFPFDEQAPVQEPWGAFGRGYFMLPALVFHQQANERTVTITVPLTTIAETCQQLTQRRTELTHLFTAQTKQTLNQSIQTEELMVAEWLDAVEQTISTLNQQQTLKKVVLARQLHARAKQTFNISEVVQNLAVQQPNTYLFLLENNGQTFVGATPERLLAATTETFETVALAGSTPRGKTATADEQLGNALLADPKNTYEHQVVATRVAQELAPIVAEDVIVSPRTLIKTRDIQHLFQKLSGKRNQKLSFAEAVQALHPTPALGGEPKQAAYEWIRTHEPSTRGMYGAPIGWIDLNEDSGEFAVGIRSALIKNDQAWLYAGCGIVADSVPEAERRETTVKFQPMLRGIGAYE